VRKKGQTASEIGIESRVLLPPASIGQAALEALVDSLNADPGVDGVLVQSPLPSPLDERAVFGRIAPGKDVDGFNPVNLGKLAQGDESGFAACTPSGIMELLARSGVDLEGKHVVVLGRSLIVGMPAALLALQKEGGGERDRDRLPLGTVDLPSITRQADVLIAAIGRPEFVTAGHGEARGRGHRRRGQPRRRPSTKKTGYRLVGDVDFKAVAPSASKITPVPGGVGPMTVAMLMRNTVKAFRLRSSTLRRGAWACARARRPILQPHKTPGHVQR
jgi:methylenetetrahydrofolate dehydrogenase (NADP+)/methenyltetrahydrofolate cyclohydrolase